MRELILISGGIICVVAGLFFLPLPTPFGLPLLFVGGSLIIAGSTYARGLLKRFRTRNDRAHRWISKTERYMPVFVRWPLRQTRPDKTGT
jgi:hypothetical protein